MEVKIEILMFAFASFCDKIKEVYYCGNTRNWGRETVVFKWTTIYLTFMETAMDMGTK